MAPPVTLNRTLETYVYHCDDGVEVAIRMNKVIGDALGNPATDDPVTLSIRHNKLRHLNLKYEDGGPGGKIYRKRVVCCELTNPHWTDGTDVSISGQTWTVTSRAPQRDG